MTLLDRYNYELDVKWSERRSGTLLAEGLPVLEFSPPPEFSGEAGKWTPEHLLLGATASCLMATFFAIAEFSHVQVVSFAMHSTGTLEKIPGEGYRFAEIVLRPEIGVAEGEQEKAQKALKKAEKGCFITNSLRTTVVVEPKIFVVATEVAC